MKKLLLPAIISLFFYSCNTTVFERDTTQWTFVELKAKPSDWQEYVDNDGKNRYYSCSYNVPEIDHNVYNYGAVLCYVDLDGAQQILPYVRHYEDLEGAQWTRTVDFEYSQGKVNLFVTNSDFVVDRPSETMYFRLVLIY
ncbi:MAG: hypothetical protein ACOX59_07425 [Bacteroidales bacterium]|jgi:hypothetical protein|nr:hypothetical protein [Bacteroidota bacterium]NLV37678.1 hypothetical protein [Bacteroidales bacterium]